MSGNEAVKRMLRDELDKNPLTSELNLELMDITDLLPLMDLLAEFGNLKKLNLHGNKIRELPLDMSRLKSLQQLDLSNNYLDNPDLEVESLKTLPRLTNLVHQVKKERKLFFIENLKNINIYNDTKILREYYKEPYKLKYMNETQLKKVQGNLNKIYRRFIKLENMHIQEIDDRDDENFQKQIEGIINSSLNKLNSNKGELTEKLEHVIFLLTNYKMFDVLKNKLHCLAMDVYGDMGTLLNEIGIYQDDMMKGLIEQSLKLCEMDFEFHEMKKQNKGNFDDKIFERSSKLEKEIKRLKKIKEELNSQIQSLEAENKRYLDILVRYSRGEKQTMVGLQLGGKQSTYSTNKVQGYVPPQSIRPLDRLKTSTFKEPSSASANYHSTGRNLTAKQLKDTIQEIYESKLKFDQKNFDGKLPRETMHQHLFTYLNQKYGLKNLTIEAASSIITGIKAYSAEDNDVAVFGKILQNEVDEQFRNVQTELKTTIHSLLKMHIKNQQPYKSVAEIQQIFNEKTNGEITSEEAKDIVRYLYNKSDASRIMAKLDMLFKLHKPKEESVHHRRMVREESLYQNEKSKLRLKFSIFLHTVLDFQLRNHERLLKPLIRSFKLHDRDYNGIINEEEFIAVIEDLCEEANDIIQELLMIVDPYETKSITFTQVVRLVANYPENNPILSRFIDENGVGDEQDEEVS